MARVVLENLSKIFKGAKGEEVCALNNASLVVEDRELLVLVGPSGCGKSTTLRMIAGLEEITRGTIAIDGVVVNRVEPKDRDIAMVFQNYALYPHMTVYENMAFGLKLRKLPKDQIKQRVNEAAEILGLAPYLDRLPKALSGGQRQRVAVGRAIVRKPKVFLFDEPLSNLDAQMRAQTRVEISKLHQRLGATMIYVTHDQVEAMTMGDRIVVMNAGVIQQVADPMTLYHQPANLFVAGFIGSPPMNFFRGAVAQNGETLVFQEQDEKGAAPAGGLALRVTRTMARSLAGFVGRKIVLGLRPEDIAEDGGTGSPSAGETGEARVEVVEPLGAETHLHLTTGAHAFVARVQARSRTEVKQRLRLAFDMSKAHFFDPSTGLTVV
ncbi:MAG: ABC transporter ATP-binding protein [Limisphaerales bacterium]